MSRILSRTGGGCANRLTGYCRGFLAESPVDLNCSKTVFFSWKSETDRFYVWADAVDKAYKIAVDHVYRELNAPYHEAVDAGEGGGRYDVELDEQHREVEVDTEEQWYHLMYGNRDDFYLG